MKYLEKYKYFSVYFTDRSLWYKILAAGFTANFGSYPFRLPNHISVFTTKLSVIFYCSEYICTQSNL